MARQDRAAGEVFDEFIGLRGSDRTEQRAARDFAQGREQFGEAPRIDGELRVRRCLPARILECPLRDETRGMRYRPRAEHFAQAVELLRRAEDEADARAGQAEELAERAQHDQVRRILAAGQRGDAVFRLRIAESLVDDQPAATFPELVRSIEQVLARQRLGRRIVRIAQQHVRRHRRQHAREIR